MKKVYILLIFCLVQIISQAQTIPAYVPTNGLVAFWPFNGNANDASGNGNNGAVNGATLTTDRNGNANSAYNFDGANCSTRIDVNLNTSTIQNSHEYSISFWVLKAGAGCMMHPRILEFYSNYNGALQFNWDVANTDYLSVETINTAGLFQNITCYSQNWLNTWNQIVFTVKSGQACLFLNGSLINSFSFIGQPNLTSAGSFGRMNHPAYNTMNGKLDDIGIWNRALTQQEITALYLSGQPCPSIATIQGPNNVNIGNTITLTDSTVNGTWSSSNTTVASINSSGVVTGHTVGTTIISYIATTPCGLDTATYAITVNANPCLPNYIPTNGLVGYWPFCGNANDESGNGNNGTVNGATLTSDRNGNANQAYNFSANSNMIGIPNTSINPQNFTISLWCKILSPWSYTTFNMLKVGPNNPTSYGGFSLRYDQNDLAYGTGNYCVYGSISDASNFLHTHSNFYGYASVANWNHFVLIKNVDTTKLYINNQLETIDINGPLLIDFANAYLQIGNQQNLNSNTCGIRNIDDIGIWNRALTQQEITGLYTSTSTSNCTFSSNHFVQDTLAVCGSSYTLSAGAGFSNYNWSTGDTTQSISVNNSGWYQCTVSNGAGCTGSDSVYVSLVNANILQNDTTICAGNTILLNVIASSTSSSSSVCSASNLPTNLQQGLVGYWPFCGNANDASGNGNHGTVNGATLTTDRYGNVNSAYNFDGVDDYISLSAPFFNGNTSVGSLSYSTWIKINSLPAQGTGYYISAKEGYWRSVSLGISSDGIISFGGSQPSPQNYFGVSSPINSVLVNTWQQINVTFDNGQLKLYLNGVLIGSAVVIYNSIDYSYLQLGNSTSTNYFGAAHPVSPGITGYITGFIDEFAVWNRALNLSEIQQLYTQGQSTYVWSTGATTATINVSPTQTTTYYCTVNNGISSCTDSVTVTVNPLPTNIFAQDTIAACGLSYTLSTGIGYSNYNWNTGDTISSVVVNNSGWYQCTVSNNAGCTGSDSVYVSLANANILQNDTTVCVGSALTFTNQSNSLLNDTVLVEQFTLNVMQAFNYSTSNLLSNTTYLVKVSGTAGFAGGVNSQDAAYQYNWFGSPVTPWPFPSATSVWWYVNGSNILRPDPNLYNPSHIYYFPFQGNGQSLNFSFTDNPYSDNSGSLDFTIYKLSSAYSYLWSTGDTTATINVTPTQTTTYYCTVSNGISSCIDSVTVTVNSLPTNIFSQDTIVACGSSYTLSAGTGYSIYNWNTGDTTSSIAASNSGWYQCTVTNSAGCTGSDSVYVSLVNANILQNDTTICAGNTILLNVIASSTSSSSSVCSASNLPSNLQQGLVGYWPFCGNANDASGNGNHGTVNGATLTTDRFGNSNQAYSFDGIDDYISVSSNFYDISVPHTISMWVSINDNQMIGQYLWNTTPHTGEAFVYNWYNITSSVTSCLGNGVPGLWSVSCGSLQTFLTNSNNTWCQYTMTYNNGTWLIYINGILLNTFSSSNLPSGIYSLVFGDISQSFSSHESMNGKIDDIGIWNRALTQQEITQLFNLGNQTTTYLWSTGDTTSTINVSPTQTTTYYCTVSNGISSCIDSVTVTVNSLPTNIFTQDTIVACGSSYTLSAGAGYSNYNWSTGDTTSSITVNNSGWYQCTVSNSAGCTASDTIYLAINALPTVTANATATTVCAGTSVTLTGGGANTYSWSGGITNGVSFLPTATTTYSVTGTNAAGCTNTATINLSLQTASSISVLNTTNASCNPGCDGTATMDNIPNMVYSINPAVIPPILGNVITGLCAGTTYTITGTSSVTSGCTSTTTITTGTVSGPVAPTVLSSTPASCNPGCNGIIILNSPIALVYSIAPSGPLVTGNKISSLCAGTVYTVTGIDAGGCSVQTTISVGTYPNPPAPTSVVTTNATCTPGCDGVVTMSPPIDLTYSVSPGGLAIANVIQGLCDGIIYTVTGTDVKGCTATTTISVSSQTGPLISVLSTTNASCNPGCDGTATMDNVANMTYSINPSVIQPIVGNVITGLCAGTTYTITGTSSVTGCTSMTTVTINLNALPTVTATSSATTVCAGTSVTLTGGGATTYTWSGGVANGVSFIPTATTTYTVTGTNAAGCTNTATQTITVNTLPTVTANASATTVCTGDSVTLTGGGASTYSWSGGVTNGVSFIPTATTTYTVTGTNAAGCTNTATTIITVNALPTVTATSSVTTVCAGTSVTLNGGGASTYTWSGGVVNGVSFIPTATTTYTVTGTNANGCTNTATKTITVNALPILVISASKKLYCEKDISGTLTGNPVGGVWSGIGVSGNTFNPIVAGLGSFYAVYTFTASNGCTNKDSLLMTVSTCLGIEETTTANLFSVYPNPTTSEINVKTDAQLLGSEYIVYDNSGKIVLKGKIKSANTLIKLSDFSAGVYYFTVANKLYGKQTIKVIKE